MRISYLKILFHDNYLNIRGSSVAIRDYAFFLKQYHNIDAVISSSKGNSEPDIVKKIESEFEVRLWKNFSEIEDIAGDCDYVYFIKSGEMDERICHRVPSLIHSVFNYNVRNIHGHKYAVISPWLSKMSKNIIPFVPHIVHLPYINENLRKQYSISDNCLVFGRYGGYTTFDIPFVKKVIEVLVNYIHADIVFLFMNTAKFIDHPNVKFLKENSDPQYKRVFINTCDAMLHARLRGETFGLSCGEFSFCNKPVFTYGGSPEKAHIDILGDQAIIYNDAEDLLNKIQNFKVPSSKDKFNAYSIFSPEYVIKIFQEVFLK